LTSKWTVNVGLSTTDPHPSGTSDVTVADLQPLVKEEIVGVWEAIISASSDAVEDMNTVQERHLSNWNEEYLIAYVGCWTARCTAQPKTDSA
jgi:hypothetical protein